MNGNIYWGLALALVFGFAIRFVIVYLKVKKDNLETETERMIFAHAPELIAQAEKAYESVEKAGAQKMAMCVESILPMIPEAVASLFPGDIVQAMIQTVFNSMQDFANMAIDEAAKGLAQKSVTSRKSKNSSSKQNPKEVPVA